MMPPKGTIPGKSKRASTSKPIAKTTGRVSSASRPYGYATTKQIAPTDKPTPTVPPLDYTPGRVSGASRPYDYAQPKMDMAGSGVERSGFQQPWELPVRVVGQPGTTLFEDGSWGTPYPENPVGTGRVNSATRPYDYVAANDIRPMPSATKSVQQNVFPERKPALQANEFYTQEQGGERTSAGGRSSGGGGGGGGGSQPAGQTGAGETPPIPDLGPIPTEGENMAAWLEQLSQTRAGHIFEVPPLLQRILNRRGMSDEFASALNAVGMQGVGDIGLFGFNTDYIIPGQFNWTPEIEAYINTFPPEKAAFMDLILATALGMEAPDPFKRPMHPEATLASPAIMGDNTGA